MAYKIVNMWLPSSKYAIKAPYAMTPQYITVHNTGNTASARNEATYHNNNNMQVSYHVAIDDKEAIQLIPFNRNAWHAGDSFGNGNMRSIGIEICYSMDNGYSGAKSERYKKAEDNAALYIAHVLKQYGWGIDRLKRHYDWSGKDCPHKMHATNSYQAFRNLVKKYLDELNGVKKAPAKKPASKPKPTTKKETPANFNKRKGRKARAKAYAKGVVRSTNGKGAAYRRWSGDANGNPTFKNRFGNDIKDGSVVYIFSTHKTGWARIYSSTNKGWIHLDQVQITDVY